MGVGRPFEKENKASRGNPLSHRVAGLRAALYEAITREEIVSVWKSLYSKAIEGDPAAMTLLLKWAIVKPIEPEEDGEGPKDGDTIATIKIIHTSDGKAKSVVIPEEKASEDD
jgi:hypothetical protein